MNSPALGAPLLAARNITKSFDGVQVLRGVSFEVFCGRAVGFVGGNGSGKSTTMNIVGGIYQPDGGAMEVEGRPYRPSGPRDARDSGISFIHQELNLFPNLSIAENISLEHYPALLRGTGIVDWRRVRNIAAEAMASVGLAASPDVEVSTLSPGEQQLVEVAKALVVNPRLIIFDEPTTSLTVREIDRLFEIVGELKQRDIGIVFISHALRDVRQVCDEIVVLRDGAVTDRGDVAAMSTDRIVSGMIGRTFEHVFPARPTHPRTGEPRLSVRGLTRRGIARSISFDLYPGEILGVCGLMGSGRTELARMIFGLDDYDSGEATLDGKEFGAGDPIAAIGGGVAFLTEDRRIEGLMLPKSVSWNIELPLLSRLYSALAPVALGKAREDAVTQAKAVNVKALNLDVAVSTLSGGNQQKVVLAKWLNTHPKVLILDEPTRGIDIGAKVEIYALIDALAREGMSVLLISSENEELLGLSDRILILSQGEIVGAMARGDDGFNEAGLVTLSVGTGAGQ